MSGELDADAGGSDAAHPLSRVPAPGEAIAEPRELPPLTAAEEARLVEVATTYRDRAAAPYSGFHVGAALLADDGTIVGGCNVESASYGLTVCAERTAVFKAISEGVRSFRAVAVVTGADTPTAPCGACRQVLWDQCRDIHVVLSTTKGGFARTTMKELLPRAFEFGGPSA